MADISSYEVLIEFETGSWTNVIEDVIQISISQQIADMISPLAPAEIDLELDNQHGFYSNSLAALVRPNLQLAVLGTHQGSSRQFFRGYIDQWEFTPSLQGPRHAILTGRDSIKNLLNQRIVTSLYANQNISSLYTLVLDQLDVSSYHVDAMTQVVPFADLRDITFAEAMERLLGVNHAYSFVCPRRCLRVEGPYEPETATVLASLSDTGGCIDLLWTISDDRVFNKISVDTAPRAVADVTSVAALDTPVLIPGSGSTSFWIEYVDPDTREQVPALDLVTPVASTDYQVFQNSGGTGADRTSTTSVDTTFYGGTAVTSLANNTDLPVWLTKFSLRGKPAKRLSDVRVTRDASSSQAVYTEIQFAHANDLIGGVNQAADLANFLERKYEWPTPLVSGTWRNRFPLALDMGVGGVVHLVNSFTNTASDFFVRGFAHTIDAQGGWVHDVTLEMEMVAGIDVLILDNDPKGKLDIRRLGY